MKYLANLDKAHTGKTAMNPRQADETINMIKSKIAIPIHYKIGNNSAEIFKNLVNNKIKVEILQQEK